MKNYTLLNLTLWIEPDWDGEYQLNFEYYNEETDTTKEKTKSYKTLKAALKAARKYDISINLI